MRAKVLTVVGVVLGLLAAGCSDEQAVDGTFYERVELQDAFYTKDTAIRLELFQFGNEAGGIVRYYRLGGVSPFESPFDREPRACFWTEPITLKTGQVRLSLRYRDDRNEEVRLTLDREEEGLLLSGRMSFPERPEPTLEQSLDLGLNLERQDEEAADRNCDFITEQSRFDFDVQLFGQEWVRRITDEKEGEVSGQMRVAVLWVGTQAGNASEVADWAAPVQNFGFNERPTFYTLHHTRSLSPGQLTEDDLTNLPFATNSDRTFSMLMGIVFIYRDTEVATPDTHGDVPMDWNQGGNEALVGTPFQTLDGGMTFAGKVLLYTQGDIGAIPPNYKDIFGNFVPKLGYEVVEVVFDSADNTRQTVKRIGPSPSEIRLFAVEEAANSAASFPRLEPPLR